MARRATRRTAKPRLKTAKGPSLRAKAAMTRLLKAALSESEKEMRTEVEAERLPAELLTLHFRTR